MDEIEVQGDNITYWDTFYNDPFQYLDPLGRSNRDEKILRAILDDYQTSNFEMVSAMGPLLAQFCGGETPPSSCPRDVL